MFSRDREIPGSYRLTGSLVVGNGSLIDVDASRVSIDLNGFSIRCEPAANCFVVAGSGINGISETLVIPGSGTEIDGDYCGSETICP